MKPYGDFDVKAFHAALDTERQARGLTWAAVARELNRPIAHLPQIHPYSPSTLSGMTTRRVEGLNPRMVMNVMRWLGRTPESFVPGHPDAAIAAEIPAEVPRGLGRWDFSALHSVIEARRAERGMTLGEAAAEMGVAPTTLKKVAAGRGLIGVPAIVRIAIWVGRPATDFFVWLLQ